MDPIGGERAVLRPGGVVRVKYHQYAKLVPLCHSKPQHIIQIWHADINLGAMQFPLIEKQSYHNFD